MRIKTFLRVLILGIIVLFYQNCSFLPSDNGKSPTYERKVGGDGYPGKVYVNRGDCGNDVIGERTVIREVAKDQFAIVRDACTDLANPISVPTDNFRYSAYDASVFLRSSEVFDEIHSKLTTAFCYGGASEPDLELLVWYKPDAYAQNADPRLATELYAQIYSSAGHLTDVLTISPPEVFTDRLAYRANDFEFIQTRSGINSHLKFTTSSGTQKEVQLTCHAQASPKYLEADQGYLLKLSPELAAGGTQFAVLSHVENSDLFKKMDSSAPTSSINSLDGWNAGYLKVNNSVYEMRKQINNKICLGPAADPRAPCVIEVLGSVKSNDFPKLYEDQRRFALSSTTSLMEASEQLPLDKPMATTEDAVASYYARCGSDQPYPKHIHLQRMGAYLRTGSDVLIHTLDPTLHANLRLAVIQASRILIDNMPADLFRFPLADCSPGNNEMAAQIFRALQSAYIATELGEIKSYLSSKGLAISAEIMQAKKLSDLYRREKIAPLASMMVITERMGAHTLDLEFASQTVLKVTNEQILERSQSVCPSGSVVYGGWKRIVDGQCGQHRVSPGKMVEGILDLHSLLTARNSCALDCQKIEKTVLAFLSFHYLFPNSGAVDLDTEPIENRIRIVPRLFGFAHQIGLRTSDSITMGFDGQKKTLADLRETLITQSPVFSGYQTAIMSRGLFEDRLAELLVSP